MPNIFVHPEKKTSLYKDGKMSDEFKLVDGQIPNLIWPKDLPAGDEHARSFYNGRARQYEDTLHLTFFTHSLDEVETRNKIIDRLGLNRGSKVLEIACGTGRDSVLIAERLGKEGELHVQDISDDMIKICVDKLEAYDIRKSFCLSNAHFLPYPDGYFDAVYSFGAMGEFSDKQQVIKEMVRVTKPAGKILFGDESVGGWLRKTEYYKILLKTNPMFEAEVPLEALPVEARNVNLSWIIGNAFYVIDFEVGTGEPSANFDFPIPGERGGTYRTRYEGELEGVTPETKTKAWEFVRSRGLDMHSWLNKLINDHLKNT